MSDLAKKVLKLIAEMIRPENRIVAVYLFGSSMGDDCKASSDVDLAFLLDERQYLSDPLAATSPAFIIAAKLGMAIDRETDVTILNGASLEIAYEVVTSGRCIYATDPDRRLEYESKIRGLYFDFIPFISKLRSETLGRSKNRRERS